MPVETSSRAAKPASGAPIGGEMQILLNPALSKVSPHINYMKLIGFVARAFSTLQSAKPMLLEGEL